jgi:hypothetical protein
MRRGHPQRRVHIAILNPSGAEGHRECTEAAAELSVVALMKERR